MRSRGVCRLSVCVSVNFFAGIATTTPKMARSLPNLHRMVSTWARIQVVLKVEVKVKGHVIGALLCWSQKSLLVAGKWPDCNQTCTRWSPDQPASRVCSRSRSKVMWYGHFCAGPKIAFSRREMARLRRKLHTMVYKWACIQSVLKIKLKVKGHMIRALFWWHE